MSDPSKRMTQEERLDHLQNSISRLHVIMSRVVRSIDNPVINSNIKEEDEEDLLDDLEELDGPSTCHEMTAQPSDMGS